MGQLGYRKTRHRQHQAKRRNKRKQPARRIHIHRPARRKLAVADSFIRMARPSHGACADYTLAFFWFAATDTALPQFCREIRRWGLSARRVQRQRHRARSACARDAASKACTSSSRLKTHCADEGGRCPYTPQASPPATMHSTPTPHESASRTRASTDSSATHTWFIPCHTAVIVPKVENLLLPVPVSGSHQFSTLRMEPCWMALGQAAGAAAAIAIDRPGNQCRLS